MNRLHAPSRLDGRVTAELVVLVAVGLIWLATMGRLVGSEILDTDRGEDVRALVAAARLDEAHASARYEVLLSGVPVGELSSTVSGGQRDDQLAYVVTGHLSRPQRIDVNGFVLADWERRPERFVIEVRLDGRKHRIEGGLAPRGDGGVLFEARYVPPPGSAERTGAWVLPEPPRLAPGPLPVPELAGLGGEIASRDGVIADPVSGAPTEWRVQAGRAATFELDGADREAAEHVLTYGDIEVVVVAEPTGFPLRLDLPFGASIVLVEESR